MKQDSIKLTLLSLSLCLGVKIYSQVTFGYNSPPLPGALVQLKETNNEDGTQVNSTLGLLMPRVALKLKKLSSGNNNILSTINQASSEFRDRSSHIGLVIYNTATIKEQNLCPGLYLWKGTEWEELRASCTSSNKLCVNRNNFLFYSDVKRKSNPNSISQIENKITPKNITITWSPASENITYTTVNSEISYDVRGIPNPIIGTTGEFTTTFYPNSFTPTLNFDVKTQTITFQLENDASKTATITVT